MYAELKNYRTSQTYFNGDIISKQNRLSDSLIGLTLQILRSSSMTVGTSSLSRFLKFGLYSINCIR